jgi:hypothetical protein
VSAYRTALPFCCPRPEGDRNGLDCKNGAVPADSTVCKGLGLTKRPNQDETRLGEETTMSAQGTGSVKGTYGWTAK